MSEPGGVVTPKVEVDTLRAAREWLLRDGHVALATVVDTWGSAPVPVGGQMAIAADTRFQGSVSGGCIEGEIITEAAEVLEARTPRTLAFGVADETAWNVGLPCGGKVRVFIERLAKDSGGLALLDKAIAARTARTGLVLRTRLADGTRQIFERGDMNVPEQIAARFKSAKSALEETHGRRSLPACPGATGAHPGHRRHPHRPDRDPDREAGRLRSDGGRPAHRFRSRRPLPRCHTARRVATGCAAEDRPRSLHRHGGARPRRPHR